jgi:hypothetical protein
MAVIKYGLKLMGNNQIATKIPIIVAASLFESMQTRGYLPEKALTQRHSIESKWHSSSDTGT